MVDLDGVMLKINMLQRYRQPYIAIIDHGKVLREICSERLDIPLTIEGKVNGHDVFVYSAGFDCNRDFGVGSQVVFDGVNYLSFRNRGFKFLIFDTVQDKIVDTFLYDTFEYDNSPQQIPFNPYF